MLHHPIQFSCPLWRREGRIQNVIVVVFPSWASILNQSWKNWCHCNFATSVTESAANDFALQVQDCSALTPGSSCGESRKEGYRKTLRPWQSADINPPFPTPLELSHKCLGWTCQIVTDSGTCSDKLRMCHIISYAAYVYSTAVGVSEHFGGTTQIWWLVIMVPIDSNEQWNTAPESYNEIWLYVPVHAL